MASGSVTAKGLAVTVPRLPLLACSVYTVPTSLSDVAKLAVPLTASTVKVPLRVAPPGLLDRESVTGPLKLAGNPMKLSAFPDREDRAPAPDLDGDRERILRELGL